MWTDSSTHLSLLHCNQCSLNAAMREHQERRGSLQGSFCKAMCSQGRSINRPSMQQQKEATSRRRAPSPIPYRISEYCVCDL
uniref:Uncharacterized protein n=1 Tax=Triticum urartu TaxID=4572 RepID=A0A8R7TXH8_TRIUA